jgi:hypothetical protein
MQVSDETQNAGELRLPKKQFCAIYFRFKSQSMTNFCTVSDSVFCKHQTGQAKLMGLQDWHT